MIKTNNIIILVAAVMIVFSILYPPYYRIGHLLWLLANSPYIYSYTEGTTVETAAGTIELKGVENLDNRPDWRTFGREKSGKSLPPAGVDDIVAINPAASYVDDATGTLSVSHAVLAFHELAEAFAKIDLGMQRTPPGGRGVGAHL